MKSSASSCVCTPQRSASCPSSGSARGLLAPRRHAVLATRPSRDTSSTASESVTLAASVTPPRVASTISLETLVVSPRSRLASSPPSARTCLVSTLTGLVRMPTSSSTMSASSTHRTWPSAVTPESTGSAQSRFSTMRCVVSLPPARRPVAWTRKDTRP